jgi:hypothetical protein
MTNRMCRISVGDSPSYEVATLFVNKKNMEGLISVMLIGSADGMK